MIAEYISRYKSGFSLFLAVSICLGSLIWKSNILARSASQAVYVLDFFSGTFHSFGKGISRVFDSYGSYETIREERDGLRNRLKENLDMQVQYVRLQEENNKLRELLSLPKITQFPVIQAEVISQDPDNWFRTIIINKGSADGISPYMPVVALQSRTTDKKNQNQGNLQVGIVGKVIQVNRHSARVLPLLDQYSRIGVNIKKSGHWALMLGQSPYHDLPVLDYLSLGVFLNPGDEIISSGGDGIFPKGLPVGFVGNKIERLGSFQRTEITPAIDFKRLDFVLVIQKKVDVVNLEFPALTPENVAEPAAVQGVGDENTGAARPIDDKGKKVEEIKPNPQMAPIAAPKPLKKAKKSKADPTAGNEPLALPEAKKPEPKKPEPKSEPAAKEVKPEIIKPGEGIKPEVPE